jgi:4-amino-4-deoxy-L-arabinose transferase-like glycosyltransferase
VTICAPSVSCTLGLTTGNLFWLHGLIVICALTVLYLVIRNSSKGSETGHRSDLPIVGALAILGLMFFQGLFLTTKDSPTYDEPNHVACGYSYLETGDFRMSLAQPPVGRMFLALPLTVLKPELPVGGESWRKADDWGFARDFVFGSGNDADRIMFWARSQALLLWALLGFVVFVWSRQLFGLRAAYFSLLLYVFSPNVLAHGRLATTEMPFACLTFISAFFFWKLLEKPCAKYVVLSGVFLGLALSAKYSGLILILSFLISAILWGRRQTRVVTDERGVGEGRSIGEGKTHSPVWPPLGARPMRGVLVRCIVVLILGGMIALLSSGLSMKPVMDYPAVQAKLEQFGQEGVFVFGNEGVSRVAQKVASSVPLPRYVVGMLFNHFHFKRGHPAYLRGQWKSGGWWYYFPVAFLLKVPLPLLVLLFLALFVRLKARRRLSSAEIILVCVPVVSILWSMGFVRLNIGFRHVLFVLPFVHVALGRLVAVPYDRRATLRRMGQLIPLLLLLWYCLASVSVSPHHLAYFNEIAGGPRGGANWLVDSNLDWGQDLKRLRVYVEENRIASLKLSYFGTADPSYYGIQFEPLTIRDFEDLKASEVGQPADAVRRHSRTAGVSAGAIQEALEAADRSTRAAVVASHAAGESQGEMQYADEKWALSVTNYAVFVRHRPWLAAIQGHEDARIGYSIFVFNPSKLMPLLASSRDSTSDSTSAYLIP